MNHVFTALFPFGGLGAGALGFKEAVATQAGCSARFNIIGGIDFDDMASKDFVYLTGSPSLTADIGKLQPEALRSFAGDEVPDVIFFSPPCKGASGLLSNKNAKTAKYQRMNGLALTWLRLMFATWKSRPSLVLLENVPRLKKRAPTMVRKLVKMLRDEGYVVNEGFHDCGSLGGLAQHRRRFLLVARLPTKCPPLLYHPKPQRVRGCGEVIGELPMPEDDAGGPMHKLPRLSWMNWVRLALIPAGGDWRDLPGVLAEGEQRRAKFKRHAVEKWEEPTGTVGGSGTNGVVNVADPRPFGNVDRVRDWSEPSGTITSSPAPSSGAGAVADPRAIEWFRGTMGVKAWDEPSGVVTGNARASTGPFSVADPRLAAQLALPSSEKPGTHHNKYRVEDWKKPAHTVTSATRPGSGAPAVADPRIKGFGNSRAVKSWDEPAATVTGGMGASNGGGHVADPRVKRAFDHGYGVLDWEKPSPTVAGGSYPGQGAYSVADPRVDEAVALNCEPRAGAYGVIGLEEALGAITGHAKIDNGRFAVADPRKPPTFIPAIIAKDGTWHRPFTTLELAALQGIPTVVDGKPLALAGKKIALWREHIGNAVPPPAAKAIAEQMLMALLQAATGAFQLSNGAIWVAPKKSKRRAKVRDNRPFYGAHLGAEARA